MPALRDAAITLPDGRRLAFTEWGEPDGTPVMYFHGTPGCRLWCPDEAATLAARVRLIMPDRPGIGRSDSLAARRYGDWPRDVSALADALEISSFAVVGVSAGGAYAAACAALIPERLTRVAIVSSRGLAKYNWAERPGAVADWSPEDRAQFELAKDDLDAAADQAAREYAAEVGPLDAYARVIREALEAAEGDRWFFEDASNREIFDEVIQETFRQGFDGIKWELIDAFQPWGFRLADISIPVGLWHGSQDPWVTQEHIDFQARTIPSCSLVVWPDSGHLGFAKHWKDVLEALT